MAKMMSGSQGYMGAGAQLKTKVERKAGPGVQHVGRRTRERLISGCSVRFVRTGITVSVRIYRIVRTTYYRTKILYIGIVRLARKVLLRY